MSRSLVQVGDVEPIEVAWTLNGDESPTGATVRAYVVDALNVKQYDNGVAFTPTSANLIGTFEAGRWKGQYTYPAYAEGLEVFIEATPTGHPDLARYVRVWSRRVVQSLVPLPSGSMTIRRTRP